MFNTYHIPSSSTTYHVFNVHPFVVLLLFITFLVFNFVPSAHVASACQQFKYRHYCSLCYCLWLSHAWCSSCCFPLLCLVLPLPLHCFISSWSFVGGRLLVICDFALQEIIVCFTRNFGQKTPPYGFFASMSNLTKMPFWTSQFGPNHFH
jgi:hypothetical protein